MKNLFRSLTYIFLSLNILVFSGGLALSKMVCTSVCCAMEVPEEDDCCSKEQSLPCNEDNCCDDEQTEVLATDQFTSQEGKLLKAASVPATTVDPYTIALHFTSLTAIAITGTDLPPPPGGRSLLHSIHRLTV